MKQNSEGGRELHFFVSAMIFVGTIVGGVYTLVTKEYGQIFVSQDVFVTLWLCAISFEVLLLATSILALYDASQNTKRYELKLIPLLRHLVDSQGFKYFVGSLAKNPGSDELLKGFNEQIAMARACLEMILLTANPSTCVLLDGIVSDVINSAIPTKGSEEKWREVVRNAQERLEIKTTD